MADPHAETAQRVLLYKDLVISVAGRYKVPPELVLAVIDMESGGNPDAYRPEPSIHDASFGLMQLLLETARGLGYQGPPRMLFDPVTNIALGVQDLAGGIRDYGSEWVALIDYNGGPRAVWYFRHGWKRGAAVHYANVVYNDLRPYYARRLAALAAPPKPS